MKINRMKLGQVTDALAHEMMHGGIETGSGRPLSARAQHLMNRKHDLEALLEMFAAKPVAATTPPTPAQVEAQRATNGSRSKPQSPDRNIMKRLVNARRSIQPKTQFAATANEAANPPRRNAGNGAPPHHHKHRTSWRNKPGQPKQQAAPRPQQQNQPQRKYPVYVPLAEVRKQAALTTT